MLKQTPNIALLCTAGGVILLILAVNTIRSAWRLAGLGNDQGGVARGAIMLLVGISIVMVGAVFGA